MDRDYPVGSIITQVITAGDAPPDISGTGPRTDEQLVSDIESIADKTKTKGDARKIDLPALPKCRSEIDMSESNLKQACRRLATAHTKDRLFRFLGKARTIPAEYEVLYRIPPDLDFVENILFYALQHVFPRSRSCKKRSAESRKCEYPNWHQKEAMMHR